MTPARNARSAAPVRPTVAIGLTRDAIVGAACELLDEEGSAGGLSMRRLAERIGVSAPTLYWHFAKKDELLAGVVDRVLARLLFESASRTWQTRLRALACAVHDHLMSHPWLHELMGRTFPPAAERLTAEIVAILESAGLRGPSLALHTRLVLWNVLGFAHVEQSVRTSSAFHDAVTDTTYRVARPDGSESTLGTAFAQLDLDELFEAELAMLVATVERALGKPPARPARRRPAG